MNPAALIPLALTVTLGAAFATLKKVYKAICNIFEGKKLFKSFTRLAGAIGGGYGGALAGAMVGSLIAPGFGTLLGGIIGGCLGSTISIYAIKYLNKLGTYLFNRNSDAINKTNPEKYALPMATVQTFKGFGFKTDTILTTLQKQKNEAGLFASLPFTDDANRKAEYKELLQHLRDQNFNFENGGIQVTLANHSIFTWKKEATEWERTPAPSAPTAHRLVAR